MYTNLRKLRNVAVFLAILCAAVLAASCVQAQDAAGVAHRVLRRKILHDAGDRYDVRFITTHTDRLPGGSRTVTGRGRFRRRGKSAQSFTYHATVDRRRGDTRDVGYDIH